MEQEGKVVDFGSIRQTYTAEEEKEIGELEKEFRMKGLSDEDARKEAEKMFKTLEEQGEKAWDDFVRKINLAEVYDDCIRRHLVKYKKACSEKGTELDFRLDITRKKAPNSINVGSATLTFSIKSRGVWFNAASYTVSFDSIKEAKDEKSWRFQLYDALMNLVVYAAVGHLLIQQEYAKQKISSETQQGPTQ